MLPEQFIGEVGRRQRDTSGSQNIFMKQGYQFRRLLGGVRQGGHIVYETYLGDAPTLASLQGHREIPDVNGIFDKLWVQNFKEGVRFFRIFYKFFSQEKVCALVRHSVSLRHLSSLEEGGFFSLGLLLFRFCGRAIDFLVVGRNVVVGAHLQFSLLHV